MVSMLHPRTVAGALSLIIAGFGALPAQASPSVLRGFLNAEPAVASRGTQAGTREVRVAVDQPLGPAPAMSAFRLDFGRSDHRIQRMMIMPDGTAFRAALSDQNGDDSFRAMGVWWVIPGATGGTVSGLVRGVGDFEVPPGPPNTTLVLSGFDFRRADGGDANVRTLAIQLDGESRRIRTVLLDDQGTDFTALAEAVGVGFAFSIIGGPTGALGGAGGMANLNQGPVNANSRLRAYNVEIAYAWVPNRYVDTMREVSGSDRRRSAFSGALPGDEQHALTGFSFHFGNADHFIGRMGVHMGGPDPVISWQDSNLDDPIQWSVRYVPVRPDPQANLLRPRVSPAPGTRD